MDRVAVTVHLRPGSEERVAELLADGPPFDPGRIGLARHTVYAQGDTVVFVFEGEELERKLSALLNDRLRSGAFAAWAALVANEPRLAHAVYHWDREEDRMKTILIAIDGSPSAQEAVEVGLALAEEQHARPVFAHVARAVDELDDSGWTSLESARALAAERGLQAETAMLRGDPAHQIVAHAEEVDADLIVVGSRGHGAIASALLGSVSRGILHEARRPVLVASEGGGGTGRTHELV
jgi:nucleotide-binding universal stress UspA family protein